MLACARASGLPLQTLDTASRHGPLPIQLGPRRVVVLRLRMPERFWDGPLGVLEWRCEKTQVLTWVLEQERPLADQLVCRVACPNHQGLSITMLSGPSPPPIPVLCEVGVVLRQYEIARHPSLRPGPAALGINRPISTRTARPSGCCEASWSLPPACRSILQSSSCVGSCNGKWDLPNGPKSAKMERKREAFTESLWWMHVPNRCYQAYAAGWLVSCSVSGGRG
jgi:hypothetical protein